MIDMLMQYGLFLAKALTIVVAVVAVVGAFFALSRRERAAERLEVKNLNKRYDDMHRTLCKSVLSKKAFKEFEKQEKKQRKARDKGKDKQPERNVFVINFRGDIRATGVGSLREEITAVLGQARDGDEVVLRLENAGGLVHEHGLAASQLMRLKERHIPLTVAVDKVAASGGYMMACVGDRIIAAPFAVLGSIGVIAQLPNFHRWLDSHGIDFELVKAGEYKRTVTLFGETTDKDREKLRQDVEDTHALFKEFVAEQRAKLDVSRVSTGEHWYGRRALELHLVDELMTSDDYLLAASRDANVYEIRYTTRKPFGEALVSLFHRALGRSLDSTGVDVRAGGYGA